MGIIATGGDGKKFETAPAGLYQGICVDVVDLGVVEVTYSGETKRQHKVRIAWQIHEADSMGRRFLVQKRYTLSLHEKASLRKDLESWRGQAFTADELKGFDLEKLLGANCQLNVNHAERDGSVYANVIGIVPLGRGMAKLPVDTHYVRVKDRTDTQTSEAGDATLTDDDIPFAWLLPLVLPMTALIGAGVLFA